MKRTSLTMAMLFTLLGVLMAFFGAQSIDTKQIVSTLLLCTGGICFAMVEK